MTTFDGILVFDKPAGSTSREVVDRAHCWFPRRTRIGHTGTLDPLATGVLVLCVGNATRLVEYVQQMGKTYRSCFRLGETSDSDDAEGTVTVNEGVVPPTLEAVKSALARFVGAIEQVPPAYSAAKIAGQRAHALARQGEAVDLAPRSVEIHAIELLRYAYPDLEVEVRCGKGTYIRSLARDTGRLLGSGAHVRELRRTRLGPFTAEGACRMETLRGEARAKLQPSRMALSELHPVVEDPAVLARLRRGQSIPLPAALTRLEGEAVVCDGKGEVVAVGRIDLRRGLLRPVKVLG